MRQPLSHRRQQQSRRSRHLRQLPPTLQLLHRRLRPQRPRYRQRRHAARRRSTGRSSRTRSRTTRTASGRSEPKPRLPTTTRRARRRSRRHRRLACRTSNRWGTTGWRGRRRLRKAASSGWSSRYAKPVFATAVRIRESMGPGAIIKVDLYDDKGAPHRSGRARIRRRHSTISSSSSPKTAYKTDRVRLTLATNIVSGWQEIDAVQLVGADQAVATTASARLRHRRPTEA